MTHDDIRANVPLAVAGTLSPEDSQAVITHIADCDECRILYEKHLTLFTDNVLRSATEQPSSPWPNAEAEKPRKAWVRIASWTLVAIVAVGGGALAWKKHQLARTATQIEAFVASARPVPLTSANPNNAATLYLKGQRAVIVLKNLPPLSGGNTFEGWWIVKGHPVSAGTFGYEPVFLTIPHQTASQFTITIEPSGGTQSPTQPPLVRGTLPR